MLISGSLKKDGKFWLVEIPLLDYMTQGFSKKEAYKMAGDIVESGVHHRGFSVEVIPYGKDQFFLKANNSALILAHIFRRIRQKHGLTVREAAKKLGSASPNAYAAYEQGKIAPSIETLEKLLKAIDKKLDISILAA
jgi:DNA-binding XRE family transcriptional regulator